MRSGDAFSDVSSEGGFPGSGLFKFNMHENSLEILLKMQIFIS